MSSQNQASHTELETGTSSQDEAKPAAKYSKPAKINRFGIGAMIVIQLVLAFISVGLVNYLTAGKHIRKDLTKDSQYTLSDYSLKFLKSDLLKNRKDPIKVFVISKPNPFTSIRITSILEEYRRNSAADIQLEFIDRIKDANRLNAIATIYDKKFYQDTILIDARTEAEKAITATSKNSSPSDRETIEHASAAQINRTVRSIREFPIKSLYVTAEDSSRVVAWRDEKIITTYLLSAIEGKARKFYFIVDKSEVDDLGEGSPAWSTFSRLLASQNIELVPYQISSNKPIPADAEGIAIIGLDVDFDDEEIKVLGEYWDRYKSTMFITIKPEAKLVKIRRFLASYGVMVQKDRITTMQNGRKLTQARGLFVRGNNITKGFGDQATQLDGMTRSLKLVNVDQLASKNINVFSVLNSAPGWWGETNYTKDKAKFDPGKDNGTDPRSPLSRPVPISVAVVRGKENVDRTRSLTSRMIVIGNTQFLKPNNMREELTNFVISSINWLAAREELVGTIGRKPIQNQKITIPEKQKSEINFAIFTLPCIAALFAFIAWFNRRS